VLAAVLALSSFSSAAMATVHHPTGYAAVFADCPLSNPAVTLCIVAKINAGRLILGKKTVPIDKTITLQGGLILIEPESQIFTLVGAEDGNTLSRTALAVPGGLVGIGSVTRATEATVTPELAGPSSTVELNIFNLAQEIGTGLRLPIKAKLSSPTLGSNCYVGSASDPLVLDLTTGTTSPPAPNKPIKGALGGLSNVEEKGELFLTVAGSSLVDNAFAVPAVTGCGSFYSSLLSSAIGLPSPAGHNTAALVCDIKLATTEAVKASE
jgi:hypothetical protein